MRLLIDEYSNVLMTIVGGLIILSIIVNSFLSVNISIGHKEDIVGLYLPMEKIETFECKDVYIEGDEYDLLKDVVAYSNSNKNIKDKVVAHIKDDGDSKYVEFVLKYCNDYRVKRAKLYVKEEDNNENNV